MLGRKNFTKDEIDGARAALDTQLKAYRNLVSAAAKSKDGDVEAALEAFEPLFFNNMTLVLDRYFVHRLRSVTGKDGNPLNEVELISDSLMSNGGELRGNNVVKYKPESSVTKLNVGDRIGLSAGEYEQLQSAFFADLERKFL
jgi:hypothetical protein